MKDVVYVTGSPEKAENFSRHIGLDIPHAPIELDEIQTLDAAELVSHKARQAYIQLKRPVLVEDVTLSFNALSGLPGPFVKFFVGSGTQVDEGVERMCRMLDGFQDRSAVASCTFGYFDGTTLTIFNGALSGVIANHAKGSAGFGFDKIFLPKGFDGRTAAELSPAEYEQYYTTIKPFSTIRNFLTMGVA